MNGNYDWSKDKDYQQELNSWLADLELERKEREYNSNFNIYGCYN